MEETTVRDLKGFGQRIRSRRTELGLSVRALAANAGLSPAYVTAIELGRNPSTGRPPVPSVQVVARLAEELGLDVARMVGLTGATGQERQAETHVLVYLHDRQPDGLMPALDGLLGSGVDHWLYIADPRDPLPEDLGGRATVCRWSLGAFPYESRYLDPAHVIEALNYAAAGLAQDWSGQRVGLAISDCSAVMRWVQNADTEVQIEPVWHEEVERIWAQHFGTAAAMDVCVYRSEDIQSLGLTIDQVATALTLVRHHQRTYVLERGEALTGPAAVVRILQEVRPSGVSSTAWEGLVSAAAETLAEYRQNPA